MEEEYPSFDHNFEFLEPDVERESQFNEWNWINYSSYAVLSHGTLYTVNIPLVT